MSPQARRALRIDDPVLGDACHVAQLGSPDGSSGRLCDVALNEIHPNPSQPRKRFDDRSLAALADSIRERGVLQPVIVQPRIAGGYELIVGERRWRASRIAGIATIPTLIAQPVDAGQSVELALIENVAREDLSVIEEAERSPRSWTSSASPRRPWRTDSAAAAATSHTRCACSTYPTKRSNSSTPANSQRATARRS